MIRSSIRRILNKLRGKTSTLPVYHKYLTMGRSVLLSGFNIRVSVLPAETRKYVTVGDDCILACNIIFESEKGSVRIGNRTSISNSTIICREQITFEDNIFISWGVTFCDHGFHSLDFKKRRQDFDVMLDNISSQQNINCNKNWDNVQTKPIKICSDAWIGMNVSIMKGVTIGRGAIVGAGSIVTKDVPDFAVVVGNPARVIKYTNAE